MEKNDIIKGSYDSKWLCIFLIDVSSTMSRKDLLDINLALNNFRQRIKDDDTIELCTAVFDETVRFVLEPACVTSLASVPFIIPKQQVEKSLSNVFCAIRGAIMKMEERIQWYKKIEQPYYRPCVVLFTNEATERMYHGENFHDLKFNTSFYHYDYLYFGQHSPSIYASNGKITTMQLSISDLTKVLLGIYNTLDFAIVPYHYKKSNDSSWMDTFLSDLPNFKNDTDNIELEAFDI